MREQILFVLFARMGDVLSGQPAFRALRKKFPEADLYWLTLSRYAELVPEFGKPLHLRDEPEFGRIPDLLAAWDHVYVAQPMWRHDEWKASGLHAIDLIARWCEVTLEDRRIVIPDTPAALGKVAALPLPPKWVALGNSAPQSSRNVFEPFLGEIVARLNSKGIPCATVGGPGSVPVWGSFHLHDRLSPAETKTLIDRSTLYIGPDTGTTWLAQAAPRPGKICVLDRERFQDGIVGFEIAGDRKTHDVFAQDGVGKIFDLIECYFP